MATESRVWPDVAIPPGEVLAETLDALGLSQAELARRAGRPTQAINEIVRGTKEITAETALQLERVLGVPAYVWVRLEANYRFNQTRIEDQIRLKQQIPLARKYPYGEMAKLGWVLETRRPVERVEQLLMFFGVASLDNVPAADAAYRRSRRCRVSSEALAAWLRQGLRMAQKVDTEPFDGERLTAALSTIRAMTRQRPEQFERHLAETLASVGVALVLVPHLRNTGAHGATRWLTPNKALLQMSIRGKWADVFWFSLFHELGHIVLHGRREVFIEGDNGLEDEKEKQADAFASTSLIPSEEYARLLKSGDLSPSSIRSFADRQGVAAGIVVGRLQHDGHLDHSWHNDLRTRYEWH